MKCRWCRRILPHKILIKEEGYFCNDLCYRKFKKSRCWGEL